MILAGQGCQRRIRFAGRSRNIASGGREVRPGRWIVSLSSASHEPSVKGRVFSNDVTQRPSIKRIRVIEDDRDSLPIDWVTRLSDR